MNERYMTYAHAYPLRYIRSLAGSICCSWSRKNLKHDFHCRQADGVEGVWRCLTDLSFHRSERTWLGRSRQVILKWCEKWQWRCVYFRWSCPAIMIISRLQLQTISPDAVAKPEDAVAKPEEVQEYVWANCRHLISTCRSENCGPYAKCFTAAGKFMIQGLWQNWIKNLLAFPECC